MAIFTTLITATKLLVKNMAKKKLKEKAKSFVTGDKDKKKKGKEVKREKVAKIMGDQGAKSYGADQERHLCAERAHRLSDQCSPDAPNAQLLAGTSNSWHLYRPQAPVYPLNKSPLCCLKFPKMLIILFTAAYRQGRFERESPFAASHRVIII